MHDSSRTGFALLLCLLLLAAGGKAILYDTLDPDCFWHLKVAQQLQTDGIGPLTDQLSFASLRTPWTPYSWLAELGMKRLWDWGGYRAAVAVQALTISGIFLFIALACAEATPPPRINRGTVEQPRRPYLETPTRTDPRYTETEDKGRMGTLVAVIFAAFLSLPYLSFRPATLAILLLAVVAWLLLRDRRLNEDSRAVWWVIPITALTANVHLYAFLVPLWVAALLIGSLWERDGAGARRYGLFLFGVAAAACMTPMLPGVVTAVLHYQFHDAMVTGPVIVEMQPFTHGIGGKIGLTLITLATGVAVWHRRRLRAGVWLWLILGIALLLQRGRFVPLYALIAAPVLAATLPPLRDRLLGRPLVMVTAAAVLAIGLFRVAAAFPAANTPIDRWLNRNGSDLPGYPSGAADYVAARVHPTRGRLINEFTWGGYLAWRLGDRYQVFMDGRTQLYSPAYWQATYLGDAVGRSRYLASLQADAAVLPAQRSLFHDALAGLGWKCVYRDARAQVLIPPPAAPSPRLAGGN